MIRYSSRCQDAGEGKKNLTGGGGRDLEKESSRGESENSLFKKWVSCIPIGEPCGGRLGANERGPRSHGEGEVGEEK